MPPSTERLCLQNSRIKDKVIRSFNNNGNMPTFRYFKPVLYSKYLFNRYIYHIIQACVYVPVAYYLFTESLWTNSYYCLWAYLIGQLNFLYMHLITHANFMIDPRTDADPEDNMLPGTLIAYYHHYHGPRNMPENWLIHRLDAVYQSTAENLYVRTLIMLIQWYYGLHRATWMLYCYISLIGIMQQDIHDWYHVSGAKRYEYYGAPRYYLFSLLEKIHILGTERHKQHHAHDLAHREEVHSFDDFRAPGLCAVADSIWTGSLYMHRKLSSYVSMYDIVSTMTSLMHLLTYPIIVHIIESS